MDTINNVVDALGLKNVNLNANVYFIFLSIWGGREGGHDRPTPQLGDQTTLSLY